MTDTPERANDITEALKKRAASVQEGVIRRGIKVLTEQDKAAGRKLPRDVLTYIRYVNERFLAAFAKEVQERRYALKGGNAIVVLRANKARFPAKFDSPRETRDIDMRIEGVMSEAEVQALFDQIVRSDDFRLLSGLSFGEPKVAVDEPRDGFLPGAKIECPVFLGPPLVGKAKGVPFKLELTFGSLVEGSWSVSPFPTIAELPPVRAAWADQGAFDIAHVVPEMMFADKLHAVARYGLGNTRLKDLFDLHCLSTQYALDADLVRACLLHVFHEFNEDHLLVARAADLPGLDPKRFATQEKQDAWRSDWVNWAGVPFGKEAAGQMPSIELADALVAVSAAVERLALFGPQTLMVGEEARLNRAPVAQLLGWLGKTGGQVKAPDVVALRGVVTLAGVAEAVPTLRGLAFHPDGRAPAAVRLGKLFAAARSVEGRAADLAARHGALLTNPTEVANLDRIIGSTRAFAGSILDASTTTGAPERAAAAIAEAAAAIPARVGTAFPLRALISARATTHLHDLASVADGFHRAVELLAAVGEVEALETAAAAAREAMCLLDRRDALVDTARYGRVAEDFCDEDDRRALQATIAALDTLAKALASSDRLLARTAAIREDIANGAVGKDATPEAVAEKTRTKLPKEAAWLDGEIAKAREPLAVFELPEAAEQAPVEPAPGSRSLRGG